MEELAEVCQHLFQEHIQARIAEVWLWLTQEQVQQRTDEQFVDVPMRKNLEECVAVMSWAPSTGTPGAGRQVLLRHVPHFERSPECCPVLVQKVRHALRLTSPE